jgi:hypothetical protein
MKKGVLQTTFKDGQIGIGNFVENELAGGIF